MSRASSSCNRTVTLHYSDDATNKNVKMCTIPNRDSKAEG